MKASLPMQPYPLQQHLPQSIIYKKGLPAKKICIPVSGTAGVRQYMAMGVVHDQEIGQMSDIIEVTFGG